MSTFDQSHGVLEYRMPTELISLLCTSCAFTGTFISLKSEMYILYGAFSNIYFFDLPIVSRLDCQNAGMDLISLLFLSGAPGTGAIAPTSGFVRSEPNGKTQPKMKKLK